MPAGQTELPLPDLTGSVVSDGRFEIQEVLGSGAYGDVYHALDLTTPAPHKPYALKCMEHAPDGSRLKSLQDNEIAIHQRIPAHENVVPMAGVFYEDGLMFVILEYCERGTLLGALQRGEILGNDDRIREVALQILDGLEHCHKNRVYHRDLKMDNILFSEDGTVRIADFGLATDKMMTKRYRVGTTQFMCPEALGEENDLAYSLVMNDVWSFGIILTALVNSCLPWKKATTSDKRFSKYFMDDDYFLETYFISKELNDLFKRVFSFETPKRPSLAEVRAAIIAMPSFYPPHSDGGSVSDTSSLTLIDEVPRFGVRPKHLPYPRGKALIKEFSQDILDFAPNLGKKVTEKQKTKKRSMLTRLKRMALGFSRK